MPSTVHRLPFTVFMSRTKQILQTVPTFFKYLLVALVVIFISFLFPNHVKFQYNFEEGQQWVYDDLKAPFDFAILKSEAEIRQETEAFNAEFNPYYKRVPEKTEESLNKFDQLLAKKIIDSSNDSTLIEVIENQDTYKQFGRSVLSTLYKKGVIELDSDHRNRGNLFKIRVTYKNTVESLARNFYDNRKATEFIIDTLPQSGLKMPGFLTEPLQESLTANIIYDETQTQKHREEEMSEKITPLRDMVRQGDVIVYKGNLIKKDINQQLLSLKSAYEQNITNEKNRLWVLFGYFLLTALIMSVFVGFLRMNEPYIFDDLRQLIFILMWIVIFSFVVYLSINSGMSALLYAIPFCIVPVVIKNFHNARLAFFTHITIILIVSFLSPLGYKFTFVQILAGIIAILANVRTRYTNLFFRSMLYILLVYSLAFFGLSLIEEGSIMNLRFRPHGLVHLYLLVNVFLTLLAYPLIPLLERVFGFTSEITLVELTDLDKPLLREMSIKAPGTLQHSLQVANLSEAAAKAINANALLVKVAALYHDIGKTQHPLNFIENQNNGNPHDETSDLDSAVAIIEHITKGEKMAKKAGLPEIITDFIRTHHGTTRVEYFYRKHLEKHLDEEVDESKFRYPGPKPRTKEEAILMIADSLEAAAKSMKQPTEQAINDLVENIIAGKIKHKQFTDCNLSFNELETCKGVLKKLLKSIHHVRIEYPDEKKTA